MGLFFKKAEPQPNLWQEYTFDPLPNMTVDELVFFLKGYGVLGSIYAPVGFDLGPHVEKVGGPFGHERSHNPDFKGWVDHFPRDNRPRR